MPRTHDEQAPAGRPVPVLDPENRTYFTAGRDGRLMIHRCLSCGWWCHPPLPRCPECLSTDLGPQQVSGLGTIYSYTVNWHPWHDAFPPPYVIALVALDEQPSVRITTNIVGCPVEAVSIGLRVRVCFERRGDIFLPVFTPEPAGV